MSVSVPLRDYRLLAELLVQSLEQDPNVRSVVNDAAGDQPDHIGRCAK
jgi:hypothetical protein